MADSKESKKRKYTLFKADDGRPDYMKPCAFFASAEGCKNGGKCRFMHGNTPGQAPTPAVIPVVAKPVKPLQPTSQAPTVADSGKESKKRKKNEDEEEEERYKKPVIQSVKAVAHESEEIRMIKEQMNLQKQMMEQQLEMLTNKLFAQQQQQQQRTTAPTTTKPIAPVVTAVKSQPALLSASKKTPIKAPVASATSTTPRASKMAVDDSESESDTSDSDSDSDSQSSDDDGKFLFDAVNHVLEKGVNQTTPVQPVRAKQQQSVPKPVAAAPVTASAKSPAKPISRAPVTTSSDDDSDDDNSDIFLNPKNKAAKPAATPVVPNPSKKKDIFATKANATTTALPTPVSAGGSSATTTFVPEQVDFARLSYSDLVTLTQSHRRYANDYNFAPDYTWVSTKQGGKGIAKVIAMDCEMCETTDPVTSDKESNSLVRFSVIDALEPSRVLIDQLVCPTNPISDARTRIHGITEDQLNSVKFTLRHAQAALLKLINEDTIIIGHSLHHDLKAMHIVHENVVDTAYLFSTSDPNAPNGDTIPSLRMLAEQLLQIRSGVKLHDSVDDSRISCYAAAYHLLHGGQFPAMQRGKVSSHGVGRTGQDDSTLLVHHIPAFCGEEHIERMFVSFTNVIPTKVNPISRTVDAAEESHGKTLVHFLSAKHAELAFETIQGTIKPDKQNRPQKRVFLKNGSYVNVRK